MSWGMGPAVIRSTGADNSFPEAVEHREGGRPVCQGPWAGQCPQNELQGAVVSLVTRASLRPPAAGDLAGPPTLMN